ncbi:MULTISPECIES: hypothetical protein [Bradyrhizobium]|jgi:hypothetical protein|uniref:hypothetical protein n=1 Tax=Bradyrhizobium TaxID=374 RepID=UPI000FABC3B6|nr:hypothetical protein [Bradyrhizobium denitrificans]MCL8487718.1 hypothetical protein [Bradyrhizobium denitrificans]RTM02345.1 MAG: hypothetical protein EKK32_11140 [Bradyrhizobiaceae bacterium]
MVAIPRARKFGIVNVATVEKFGGGDHDAERRGRLARLYEDAGSAGPAAARLLSRTQPFEWIGFARIGFA